MARSHPPTLIKIVKKTLLERCACERGAHLLIAVSGGGDSQALLDVLARLRKQLRIEVSAHGVNHGLRSEAGEELELARQLALAHGIPFGISKLSVEPGGNLQERAREQRYRALHRAAKESGAVAIVTAHHADDRAETVLMRILRGGGLLGLKVLPARSQDLMRPMIAATKGDVVAHLRRHQIPFCEDPSNRETRFLRTRVRHELLPMLKQVSPQIVRHLNALADDALDGLGPEVLDSSGALVRLLRPQREDLKRALSLGHKGARIRLSGGRSIRLDPETLLPRVDPET